jgi:uncharacterized protein YidB (DUF937 family)
MSLLSSVLGAVGGKAEEGSEANALIAVLMPLLTQAGGLQGLMAKFSQAGLGNVFSSWVGMGENQPISGNQIQQALGSDQIKAIAAKLGIDPAQMSTMVAEHLPKVVDKLTPAGQIDPNTDVEQGLSNLIPALLSKLGSSGQAQA